MSVVPDLRAGLCQPGRSSLPPAAWTGPAGTDAASRQLRQAAVRACLSCPVLEPCRAWALDEMAEIPAAYCDSAIVAGMDRRQRKAARAALASARPVPEPTTVPPWERYPPAVAAHAGVARAAARVPGQVTVVRQRDTDVRAPAGTARAAATAPETLRWCACGCGERFPPGSWDKRFASGTCRKRWSRAQAELRAAAARAPGPEPEPAGRCLVTVSGLGWDHAAGRAAHPRLPAVHGPGPHRWRPVPDVPGQRGSAAAGPALDRPASRRIQASCRRDRRAAMAWQPRAISQAVP